MSFGKTSDMGGSAINSARFIVMFGPLMTSFYKVSGLTIEQEMEYIQEGGVNEYVYALPKPRSTAETLVFEKAVGRKLPIGTVEMIRLSSNVGVPGTILVMDETGEIKRAYGFTSARAVKLETSELNALVSEVLIDRIEFVHTGLTLLPYEMVKGAVTKASQMF